MEIKLNINKTSYICIVIGYVLTLTTIPHADIIGNVFIISGVLIALFKILFLNHYTSKQFILFVIVGVLFLISAYRTKNYQFVYTYVFVLSATKMSMDSLIDIDLKIRIPLVFVICILGTSGVILNRVDLDLRGFGEERQSLGFTHPNNLGAMLMILTIYLFYKKHKRFNMKDYLLLIFADYMCWSVAVSRTSSIVITFVIIVELLDSIITFFINTIVLQKAKDIIIRIGSIFVLFVPGTSIYLGLNYAATPFYLALDSLFSSRFYLMHTALKNNGVTLLGQYIKVTAWTRNVIAENTNAVDNLYAYILMNFGVIFFIVIVLAIFISYIYACKENDHRVCLCILFFMVAGFCENKMFYIGANVFTVYVAVAIYQANRIIKSRRITGQQNINNGWGKNNVG